MMEPGLNIWFVLRTSDTTAAIDFYTAVIGWKVRTARDAGNHTTLSADDTAVGAVFPLPEEAKAEGIPPLWLSYTIVADVDKTAARVVELGGAVVRAPSNIRNVSRVAVLADPQGALFAICTAEIDVGPPSDKPGHFSWSELNTTDYEAAWKFYSELFGWKKRAEMDMGPAGTYLMFHDPTEKTKGGMSNMATQMSMPPHWLYYITVANMDRTIELINQNGGKVLNGPMAIPDNDLIAQCRDPQGALFAVYAHSPADRAK